MSSRQEFIPYNAFAKAGVIIIQLCCNVQLSILGTAQYKCLILLSFFHTKVIHTTAIHTIVQYRVWYCTVCVDIGFIPRFVYMI